MHTRPGGNKPAEVKSFPVKEFFSISSVFLLLLLCVLPAAAEEIIDADISLAVDRQLTADENIPAHLITVSTDNGVVTLSGSVDNLLAKERSSEIAATVRGVRSVVNLITVSPSPQQSDAEIKNEILEALLNDPATEAFEIDVRVNDGVVTLGGNVDSYQEGVLCGTIAKRIAGVVDLRNNITYTPKMERRDREVKAEIAKRFQWNVWVNEEAFEVEVKDAQVSISGTARSVAEMNNAKNLAWVTGVKSVDMSGVEVNWQKGASLVRDKRPQVQNDREIKEAIEDAFAYDPRLISETIEVMVKNGVAVLTGTASTLLEKNAAENDARNTLGVLRVKNMIKVQPITSVKDEQILQNVNQALEKNKYVTEEQVKATVLFGRVYLRGTVESFFEKNKAEELAARQEGVIDVKNNIDVYLGEPEGEDWEIREDILSELWWSPFVDEEKIRVSVKDGTAYLSGTVANINERKAAEENAYEGGATSVMNYLKVKNHPYYQETAAPAD